MTTDHIKEIKIDHSGRLCIFPEREKFSMIWRTATEVNWNNNEFFLYSPKPREWSYFDWFKHIIEVIKEVNCELLISNSTSWVNIPITLREQIETFCTFK